ncbi:MAG: FAD-dependent oxidoreductase, partial [Kiloniellales bacterium]|nr:FAD-dependent oxidoreductase [Kiloniellales bacterium]
MAALQALTTSGDAYPLEMAQLQVLEESLRGSLHFPGAAGYDDARRIWNGMIDRRPALIVRCRGSADVIASVNFARDKDLLLSVRGGGHNVSGNAVCDGGLMIDLSQMRGVHVDPNGCRARADGGTTWGDFDAETQIFGLATTGGLISDTGVAGLTLGGGIGWLTPSYGLACDNLASVDVVTAEGSLITASEEKNEDLFWGLKGGGGNFGVATSFEFEVHPVGPVLFAGMTLYPLENAEGILRRFVDFMRESPDQLGALAGLVRAPDGSSVVALIAVYNGSVSDGEAAVMPLRNFGEPIFDSFQPTPYRKIQTLFDAGTPKGLRYYWKSSFLESLPDDALALMIEQARSRPSPSSKIFLEFLGGAFSRIPREAAVFDHRNSPYNLLVIAQWERSEEDSVNRSWARETWQSMQPYASEGVYVNYLGSESDEGG